MRPFLATLEINNLLRLLKNMSLQNLKKHESASKPVAPSGKSVSAFIHSKLILLQGNWQWNLHADAVFCSDVIVSYPPDFEGTSGIIHPDDLPLLKEKLFIANPNPGHLVFRIITTYGEVKTLEGHDIFIRQEESYDQPTETWRQESLQLKWQKEYANLQLLKEIYEKDERYWATGIWYYNLVTNVTWYSDEVYRIHGLPPQSLNAHLNTFNAFIHAEDKEAVQEFWGRAFKQKIPLHIEYRIQTPGGEKHVSYVTQWFFSPKGETIVSGTVQDITDQKQLQLQIEEAVKAASFYKQQTVFDEPNALLGHWQVNLLTRKTVFSDNYYRIHGLKPQSLVAGIDAFLNYVHTDDREVLSLAYKKMLQQHEPPQLDYRIMRTDGKLHYLSLKAKRIRYGNEVIIAGTIQDVTMQKALEKKAAELIRKEQVYSFAQRQTEELAATASWVKEAGKDVITWSESFYSFLGYKPNTVELSIKFLVSFIHPDDKKNFASQLEMAEQQKEDKTFTFRLVQRGSLRYIKAFFSTRYNGETEYFAGVLHDVSREHTLQKQWQSQVQLTDALSANALDRIMVTDSSNNILLWNQQCEEFYKVKKEDALGRNFFDIFPWQKTEEEMIFFNRVLNGEKVNLQEVKSSTGKGYFNLDMLPVWDEETGEVRGIVHIIHDVTKELELRKSMNERLNFISNLLEASVDRIIALDSNMNYLYWNKKAEEYYGLSSDEILGKNILEVFPAFIDDPSYGQLRQVLRGQTIHIPPQERLHNGKKYFETYLIPVKDEKEQVSAVLWIAHDLSLEYQLTKEHKETTELLKATMDSSIDMIQVFEAVRNEAGEIIDFRWILNNHSSEKYYGDVIGKSLLQQNPGVVEAGIFDTFKRVVESGILDQSERHYAHEQFNGWFYQSVVKLNDGVATTTTDITKRKKAEQELQAAKEKLQVILENSLYTIQVFKAVRDDKGRIIDFVWVMNNQKAFEQNGDVVGKSLLEQNPGVVSEGLFDKFVAVTETGIPVNQEVFYNHEQFNGWFHQTLVKVEDGFVMSTEDITQRKRAEQELKESKQLVQTVFDISLNPIAYHKAVRDDAGQIIDFEFQLENREARKYAREDRTGKKYSEAYPGIKNTEVFQLYCDVIETGKELNTEIQLSLKSINRWFHLMGVKLDDGLVATALDITERKEAEQEIFRLKDEVAQRATDRYYTIFNSIDEGFCIYELIYDDNDQPVDLRWVEVNPAYAKQTGLKDVVGRLHSELGLTTEKYWLDTYDKVSKTGEAIRFENWHESTQRWYHTFASRIGEAGSKQVAVVFEDITERKNRQEQQAYLIRLNDALRPLADPIELQQVAMQILGEHLKADRVVYADIDIDQDYFEVIDNYTSASVQKIIGRFPFAAFGHLGEKLKNGENLVINDVSVAVSNNKEKEPFFSIDVHAVIAIPLIKNRKLVADLSVHQAKPRNWREDEFLLIQETAERIWAAVERAKAEATLRKSEEKYRTIFETIDEGFAILELIIDENGNVTDLIYREVNGAYAQHTGIKNALDKKASELFPHLEQHWLNSITYVYKTGEQVRTEGYQADLNRWFTLQYSRVGEAGSKFISVVFNNITEQKVQEQLQQYLLRLNDAVRPLANTAEIERVAMQILGEHLKADRVVYAVTNVDEDYFEVIDNYVSERVKKITGRFPFAAFGPPGKKLAEGETVVIHDVNAEVEGDDVKAVYFSIDVHAVVAVPLIKNGNFIVELSVHQATPRRWREDEIILIQETAERTWAAVERAKAEEALKESEEKIRHFNTCLEQEIEERTEDLQKQLTLLRYTEHLAQSGTWEYEVATADFKWSKGMYKIFGLPQQMKVRPETYLDFAAGEDRSVAKKIINHFKKKPAPFEEIMRIMRDNEPRTLKIKGSVVHDDKGKVQKIIGVDVDVTDVVKAEEQLKESRHWLEQTAKASPDSITIYDLQKRQPVYLNSCLAEWTGISSEELVDMGIEKRLEMIHPDDRLDLLHHNEKIAAAKDGELLTIEYRIVATGGKIIWLRNRSKPFLRDASGKVTHMLSILQNVTEEVDLRERLKQRT